MGPGMSMGHGPNRDPDDPPIYLVIGLNAEKHMAQFRQYRRAAMLQTGYVFLAAVVLWSLAFAYLRRRGHSRKLLRLESFQNKLLDNMPDGLVTLSSEGEIMSANNSAKRLLAPRGGEESPEIIGHNWTIFPFGGYWGSSRTAPYQWTQHDYEGRQLELLSLPFQEKDEAAAPELGRRLVLIRDRTQIRSLEEDLNEAKRLAAIGSLAAGVAHEVRNPLSSLRGFAQLFATKLKDQHPLEDYAKTMVQEADRLNRVVTDLLYLARPHGISPQATNLDELGDSLKRLMHFDFENRHVEPEFNFEVKEVCADQDALRQVLLNLISNSLDALVQAGQDDAGKGRIQISSTRDDGGIWIRVEDNGPGMDEAIREEAFKPFVTGKKTGTGLGLAIVQNIMRAHKGKVLIDSELGKGTIVQLYFPDQCSEAKQ